MSDRTGAAGRQKWRQKWAVVPGEMTALYSPFRAFDNHDYDDRLRDRALRPDGVCVPANPDANPAPAAPRQGSRDDGTVLVVEDNFGVAHALAGVIRKAGFDATPCHCGADALEHCRTTAPLAAVLDIHLPDINGLVLAHKLRDRLGHDIPIIIVSGDTSMETIKSLQHVGATYFFSKPVNPHVLVDRLKELVGNT
jgi:CheY-like chemotaxis protein